MRHLRLRQVLICQGYTRKELRKAVAFEHRNWKEDNESLPTIEQVRKMHKTLGTWDARVSWIRHSDYGIVHNHLDITLDNIGNSRVVYVKADYKRLRFVRTKFQEYMLKRLKEARWKEQEKRTLEFFEREGC